MNPALPSHTAKAESTPRRKAPTPQTSFRWSAMTDPRASRDAAALPRFAVGFFFADALDDDPFFAGFLDAGFLRC